MALKALLPAVRDYFTFRLRLKKVSILLLILVYASILYYLVKATRKGQVIEKFYTQTIRHIDDRESLSDLVLNKSSDIQNEAQNNKVIVVLVLVCNRMTVTRTLDAIFKYRPSRESFPVILSQDCGDGGKGVNSHVRRKYGETITYIMVSYIL